LTFDLPTGAAVILASIFIGAIAEYAWHAMLHAHHKRKGH
jgi:hypothetical protein